MPPKKQKEKAFEEKLYALLMKKTKNDLVEILASFGFEFGSTAKKSHPRSIQSGNSDKFDQKKLFKKLTS